jgi:hypothetical protein
MEDYMSKIFTSTALRCIKRETDFSKKRKKLKNTHLGRWQRLLPISPTKTQIFTNNNIDKTIS